jgi:ADP-heptose:LPS heptosyltransferase
MQIRDKQKIDKYIGYLLIALLLPFTRLLGITMFRDHSAAKPPRRILFIKLMGIGSLIVASDAIEAMRAKFPDTRFVLLTDPNIAAAIRPFGLFDEIYTSSTDRPWSTIPTMFRFFLRSWTWRRLWVVDLEVYSKLTTVLALLTLARNRFGFFLPPVPFRKYLNTHNIPFDQGALLGQNYQTMARALTGETRLELPLPQRRQEDALKPYVVLNNTCSGLASVRRLPEPVVAAVCQWILEQTTYRVALLGSPNDRTAINDLVNKTQALYSQKDRILNVAGFTDNFEEYYAFLRESGVLLISIDSGPLHMARKLGLPTISLWGPTDPANYLDIPETEKTRHLFYYSQAPCSPCVHRHPVPPCGGNNICMQGISARIIINMLRQLLHTLGEPQLSQCIEPGSPVLIR